MLFLYVLIKVCTYFCHWLLLEIHKYIPSFIHISNHMPINRKAIFWLVTLFRIAHPCPYSLNGYPSSSKHLTLPANIFVFFIWLLSASPTMIYASWNYRLCFIYSECLEYFQEHNWPSIHLNKQYFSCKTLEWFYFSWKKYLGYVSFVCFFSISVFQERTIESYLI